MIGLEPPQQISWNPPKCRGCGRDVTPDSGAFIIRGKQSAIEARRLTPVVVCYDCALYSEELFYYLHPR